MQSLINRLHFFSRFISSPRKIGSITPSSRFLVNALLNPVPWDQTNTIIELGAGTGVVTQQILQQKKPSCQVITFESDPQLNQFLKQKFPSLLHCLDAREMTEQMNQVGVQQVDCVISCLPFNNFPQWLRQEILQEIKSILAPNGLFIAYQYSLQMKSMLKANFQQVEIRFVPLNVPPSFIYICRDNKSSTSINLH